MQFVLYENNQKVNWIIQLFFSTDYGGYVLNAQKYQYI